MTSTAETPTERGDQLVTLTAAQVAQHPDNLRDPSRDLDRLAKSIAEVGVLVPLIVVPVEQVAGDWPSTITHVAVDGNRRQAAAAQVDAALPCLVRPDVAEAKDAARTMAVTGLVRDGLTVAEEARAVQTMIDLGLSQTAVAKATGRSRDYIKTAKAAAAALPSLPAGDMAESLTLDQLAVLAEFDGDEAATARLVEAATRWPHQLAHTAEQLRQQRAVAAAVAVVAAELTASGVDVTAEVPCRWSDGPRALRDLTDDPDEGTPIDPAEHSSCPGHVVYLEAYEPYEEDEPAEEDATREPARVIDGYQIEQTPCCTAWREHHSSRWETRAGSHSAGGQADDEEAKRRKSEARRELIRLNKIADAAQLVRREFCRDLLASKTKATIATMTSWAIEQIIAREYPVTDWLDRSSRYDASALSNLLGDDPFTAARQAGPTRQPLMLWAYVVAAHESHYPRDAHRESDASRAGYVQHLIALGYAPAETDRLVTGEQHLSDNDDQDTRDDQ